jgi:hypothetical protein
MMTKIVISFKGIVNSEGNPVKGHEKQAVIYSWKNSTKTKPHDSAHLLPLFEMPLL